MLTGLGRRRDKAAFLEQAVPHLDSIYRVAVRDYGNPALAQDLVQETFKEAWKSFSTFEKGTNCRAWLFKIFFRVSGRYRSRAKKFQQVDLETLSESRLSVGPKHEDRIDLETVLTILETLPKKYRTVLVLADIEELSYRKISRSLEIPIGTVMSRLNRARSIFREKFQSKAGRSWMSA